MYANQPATAREAFRQIQILFYVIIAFIFLASLITFLLGMAVRPVITDKMVQSTLFTILALIAVVCYPVLFMVYSKKLLAIRQSNAGLIEKLRGYRAGLVLYLAIYEALCFASMVIYFLSGEFFFLVIIGSILINLILRRPEKSRIFNELQLNSSEQLELN